MLVEGLETGRYDEATLNGLLARHAILSLGRPQMEQLILAAAERHVNSLLTQSLDGGETRVWQSRHTTAAILAMLLKSRLELTRDGFFDLLLYLSARPPRETHGDGKHGGSIDHAGGE